MIKNLLISVTILILLGISVFFGVTTFKSKEKEIVHDGRLRKYRLHVPGGYYEKDTYPLVVVDTGFSRKADQEGFFVVYPYGVTEKRFTPYSWNSKFCCGYALEQGVDDVGFIAKVIDEVAADYSIDTSKVFVVGFSNGGMLAHYISLKLPDKISATAVVAGAVGGMHEDDEEYGWLDQSGVPVPIVIFHGKEDTTVPFDGGNGSKKVFEFTGAYDSVNLWLQNNKCNTHPAEISKNNGYTKETYTECENDVKVVFYALDTKHIWPGGIQEPFKSMTGRSVRATDIIWEFFSTR